MHFPSFFSHSPCTLVSFDSTASFYCMVTDRMMLGAGPSGVVSFAIDDMPMAARAFDPVTSESFEVAAGGVVSVWLNLHDFRFVVVE